jgi:hypothetical protein
MEDFYGLGVQDDALIGGQVELDAWQGSRWRNWSLVADLALA